MNSRDGAAVVLHSTGDLTPEAVERIAWAGARVVVGEDLMGGVDRTRRDMEAALDAGVRVYGVNTPTGYLATLPPASSEQTPRPPDAHERNLLVGRSPGGPPYLSAAEVRALLAVRLGNFLSGYAGVTPQLCAFLVDRLNDGFTPAVPRAGMGSSGDLIALSHTFQTFVGVGLVLDDQGRPQSAAEALTRRGVAPYRPRVKEGIALLAGAPGTTAVGLARRRATALVAGQALVTGACAIDALRAPLDPYSPAVGRLSGDELLVDVLGRLRERVGSAASHGGGAGTRLAHQAPVSFRVLPQVQAHLERTVARFDADLRRSLGAVTDSPAFVDGRFVTSGEFHAVELAAGLDSLTAAVVRVAELSGQRTHRLLDRRYSGLPDQLTPAPGPRTGLITVHKRVVGLCNHLRRLAAPVALGITDTSLGQEDAMTFSFEAAENLAQALDLTRQVLACELLCARQAWWLRGAGCAPGLRRVAGRLAELVPPVDADRPLGPDVELLAERLRDGEFAPHPGGARAQW